MEHEFTTPQSIATALRRLAERLDAMPAMELPGITIQVEMDNFERTASIEERVQAIDLLSYALAGSTGYVKANNNSYINYGLSPIRTVSPEGVSVETTILVDSRDREVFTALRSGASTKSTPNTNP